LVRGARTSGENSARRQRGHLRHFEMSIESNNYETATVTSPSGARSCPMPDAAPLPLPLPLPAIADGVSAAFPLDGPIGLRLHRPVTALIRDHHLVVVSSQTHPTNVSVRPSWPELHRSRPPPSATAEVRCLEGHVRATGHLLGLSGQPAVTIFCIEGLVYCTALANARPPRSSTLRHGGPLSEVISTR